MSQLGDDTDDHIGQEDDPGVFPSLESQHRVQQVIGAVQGSQMVPPDRLATDFGACLTPAFEVDEPEAEPDDKGEQEEEQVKRGQLLSRDDVREVR